jgi:hypothetical protein
VFEAHFRPFLIETQVLTETQAEGAQKALVAFLRLLSLPVIGAGLYFAWRILRST